MLLSASSHSFHYSSWARRPHLPSKLLRAELTEQATGGASLPVLAAEGPVCVLRGFLGVTTGHRELWVADEILLLSSYVFKAATQSDLHIDVGSKERRLLEGQVWQEVWLGRGPTLRGLL